MSDKEFLVWLFNRLAHVHHENEHCDYMLKFHKIIHTERTPQWQPNAEEVLMKLKRLWDAGWFTSDDRNCITFKSIMDSLPTPPKEQP